MSDFLKGNFKPKKEVKESEAAAAPKDRAAEIAEQLKQRALASLGGSMVYMERTDLVWDGEDNDDADKK